MGRRDRNVQMKRGEEFISFRTRSKQHLRILPISCLTSQHVVVAVSREVVSDSFTAPQTVARQAPLPVGFPRQEYWRGLPLPSPRDLPNPGIEPVSLALQADSLPLSQLGSSTSHYTLLYKQYSRL